MTTGRLLAFAAAAALTFSAGTALAADAAKGAKVFKKCKACHTVVAGKHRVGPSLAGAYGRKAGTADGYKKYSKLMKAANAKGLEWDEKSLDGYLADPTKYLRTLTGESSGRGKMVYKLKKADQRADVIEFIKTKK